LPRSTSAETTWWSAIVWPSGSERRSSDRERRFLHGPYALFQDRRAVPQRRDRPRRGEAFVPKNAQISKERANAINEIQLRLAIFRTRPQPRGAPKRRSPTRRFPGRTRTSRSLNPGRAQRRDIHGGRRDHAGSPRGKSANARATCSRPWQSPVILADWKTFAACLLCENPLAIAEVIDEPL
jgi:hypothetical protein